MEIPYNTPIAYVAKDDIYLAYTMVDRPDKNSILVEVITLPTAYNTYHSVRYENVSYSIISDKESCAIGKNQIELFIQRYIKKSQEGIELNQKDLKLLVNKYVTSDKYAYLQQEREKYISKPENQTKENFEKVIHDFDKAIRREDKRLNSLEIKERNDIKYKIRNYERQIEIAEAIKDIIQ